MKSRHNFAVLNGGPALPPRAARKILAALIINGSPAERTCRSNDSAFSRFGRTCGSRRTAPGFHRCTIAFARARPHRCGDVQFFSRARYLTARLDSTRRTVREFHVRKMYSARGGVFYDAAGASQTEGPGNTHTATSSHARAPAKPKFGLSSEWKRLSASSTHTPRTRVLNL